MKEIADPASALPSILEAARRAALSAPTPSIQLARRLAELLGIGSPAEMSAVINEPGSPATPFAVASMQAQPTDETPQRMIRPGPTARAS